MGPRSDRAGVFIRRGRDMQKCLFFSLNTCAEKRPGRRGLFAPDTVLDCTLFLEFQSPELCENKFLMHKPRSLWYSVMSAQAD